MSLFFCGALASEAENAAESAPVFRLEKADGMNERVVTDVTINGKKATLVFDTGYGGAFGLFLTSVKRLGVKTSVAPGPSTEAGMARVGWTEPLQLEVFGQTTDKAELQIIDLGTKHDSSAHDGLLGWQAMKGNGLLFNLGAKAAPVLRPSAYPSEMDLVGQPVTRLRVERHEHGVLMLRWPESERTERKIRLLIDTGSADGVRVSPRLWRELVAANSSARRTVHAVYMIGEGFVPREEFWAEHVAIGGLDLSGVTVGEAGSAYWQDAVGDEETVVFGLAAMKRVEMIVDAANGRALVHPASHPSEMSEHNRIGAIFCPRGETGAETYVAHVVDGGPASRADVRQGDVLVSVNGIAAATFWNEHQSDFSGKPGTVYRLVVRRGDETLEREVVAEDIFCAEARVKEAEKTQPAQ